MQNEKLIERLKKILELARRGVGGEKDNAQSILDRLLAKHGLTIEDIEGEEPKWREFNTKNDLERQILHQCLANQCDYFDGKFKVPRDGRCKTTWVEVKDSDLIMVELLFEAHRKGFAEFLKAQEKIILSGYIHGQKLYPAKERPASSEDQGPQLSLEDIVAIRAMSERVKPVMVHRRLESKETTK